MNENQDDKDKQTFSAEDIRRYLAGEMPPKEMHALELASLDDPMLEDALTGMRNVSTDTRADLAGLRQRLAERTAESNRIVPIRFSWPRIAAAIVMMVALSALGYYFISGSASPREMALSNKKQDSSELQTAPPPAGSAAEPAESKAAKDSVLLRLSEPPDQQNRADASPEKPATAASANPVAKAKIRSIKTAQSPAAETGTPRSDEQYGPASEVEKNEKKKTGVVKDDEMAAAPDDLSKSEPAADKASEKNPPGNAAAVARAPKNRAAAENVPVTIQGKVAGVETSPAPAGKSIGPAVSGQVVDDNGAPVTGAVVQMGKTRTVTDIQGRFTLQPDRADTDQIDVSSIGYQAKTFVNDNFSRSDLKLTLSTAATALNDVEVTGYGSAKKDASRPSAPAPAPGWKKYRHYLGSNKNQPTIDSSLHGTERVSFSVTHNGQPVDFSFDESLSVEHDSVAVRMIRNGPKWKPAKDTSHRVTLALPY